MTKDRGYVTATEWREEGGRLQRSRGRGDTVPTPSVQLLRGVVSCRSKTRCARDDGTVMDIMHAVPYVQKHKKHPVTGEPLELKQLTKLTFHKNDAGRVRVSGAEQGGYCSEITHAS